MYKPPSYKLNVGISSSWCPLLQHRFYNSYFNVFQWWLSNRNNRGGKQEIVLNRLYENKFYKNYAWKTGIIQNLL